MANKYEIFVDGELKTTTTDVVTAVVAFKQECEVELESSEKSLKKTVEMQIDDGSQKVFTRMTMEAGLVNG